MADVAQPGIGIGASSPESLTLKEKTLLRSSLRFSLNIYASALVQIKLGVCGLCPYVFPLPQGPRKHITVTAGKNGLPSKQAPVYVILCSKRHNFPPNSKISLQTPTPTFPGKKLPKLPNFTHCDPSIWTQ